MPSLDILVIDDDQMWFDEVVEPRQVWFARVLSTLGHRVTAAGSSAQALESLRHQKFDLVFFDHDLGEESHGTTAATGSSLASEILCQPETYKWPRAVWVHSHNPLGAANIASKFRSVGIPTQVAAYNTLLGLAPAELDRAIEALVAEETSSIVPDCLADIELPVPLHKYALGEVVEVDIEISQPRYEGGTEVSLKGLCRLLVVGHLRDRDMRPLYILADLPVKYPLTGPTFAQDKLLYKYMATLVESGYDEASLRSTGEHVCLKDTMAQWLEVEG